MGAYRDGVNQKNYSQAAAYARARSAALAIPLRHILTAGDHLTEPGPSMRGSFTTTGRGSSPPPPSVQASPPSNDTKWAAFLSLGALEIVEARVQSMRVDGNEQALKDELSAALGSSDIIASIITAFRRRGVVR